MENGRHQQLDDAKDSTLRWHCAARAGQSMVQLSNTAFIAIRALSIFS
jgi:hypothetical protein